MVVRSVAVLLAGFTSPPPETTTVFVADAGALFATFTLRLIGGYAPLALSESTLLQLTVCPLGGAQDHPEPEAEAGVSPAGAVSVTVTAPLVAPAPELVTTIEYVAPFWP